MASINFPVNNNREIEFPSKPDMKGVFPVYYDGSYLPVGGYTFQGLGANLSVVKADDGWSSDTGKDTIWIGKDVESFEFRFSTKESVRHELTSVAFEDGRTDYSNIFTACYSDPSDSSTYEDDSRYELSDATEFPFRINRSIRLPKTISGFPGIILEAPYDFNGDSWTCDVVIADPDFNGCTINGGRFGSYISGIAGQDSSNTILINEGFNDQIFSLNSDKGTVNIYLPNVTSYSFKDNLVIDNSVQCNLRFFLADEVYEDLKSHESWTDSEANEAGYYKLETHKMTGLEAKVKDVMADSKEDIPEVTLADINEMVDAPLISILEIRGEYGQVSSETGMAGITNVQGVFSFSEQDSDDTKYVSFIYNLGSMTAYLMDENREPDSQTDTDVSSEVTIDPLYFKEGTDYVPVVSFRGGIDSKLCPLAAVK